MRISKDLSPKKTPVCITIDTEGDSANNPNSSYLGIHIILPKLLDLFDKFKIKATFFIQEDKICQAGSLFTNLWNSLKEQGHEIGYHVHGIIQASPEEREAILTQGIRKFKDSGLDPVSYRAGRFHLNGPLLKILEKNNIKYDSSVVPGLREVFKNGIERCNHIGAPTKPYFPSYEDHTKPGDSKIFELPINRYPKFSPDKSGGILTGKHNDAILFDYFHELRKDRVIIVLLHVWEGLSFKFIDAVRNKNYGKVKKFAFESLRKFFSPEFFTNGWYFYLVTSFLKYVSEKDDICFTTIKQAGEYLAKRASE